MTDHLPAAPVGRPTKYRPEYVDLARDVIGIQGKSINQFARDLRVSRQTIYQWVQDYPEFSDAIAHAREWSEAFWEDQFGGFMLDRNVNAPLVKLYMAHRFKWTEKSAEPKDEADIPPTSITIERKDARKPE